MLVTVFGATGPTGKLACELALDAGHQVRAVSRRNGAFPLVATNALAVVRADAVTGEGVHEAVEGVDAVLSVLGASYTRRAVDVYSAGTRNIVRELRDVGRDKRLIAVSSGLTYPPKSGFGFIPDRIVFPLLRNVIGRTLYDDMARMEEQLRRSDDIAWTVMRPGRLFDASTGSDYRLDLDHPSQGYTSRIDLAAAMLAELKPATAHVHQAVAPTTKR